MKKKKILIYLASALIPMIIFSICTWINGYLPFKSELLNSFDSFTQYPGIILEYMRLLKTGNIFYSWRGGLGFNFFGTLTYYGLSPLNLFTLFANPNNYHYYISIMTILRISLLGLSMAFYLDHKNTKSTHTILFSTLYALMGFTCTYYYNYIWTDSIIMLPLVIHGLDKLIKGESPAFYIFSLAFTIIINYYTGYMICIFSLIWFLYNLVNIKKKKEIIKTFIVSSILAGFMSAITILPSIFALLTGKSSLYGTTSYGGFQSTIKDFLYTLTSGSYSSGDQVSGPALIYSGIITLVLSIFYFFNKSFSKKEKIATSLVLIFFFLSFGVTFLNYSWQFFQKPIWWPSRFSFTFSFFLITLACKTLGKIDKTKFKTKYRIITLIILLVGIIISAICKWQDDIKVQIYTYFYLGFSILLIIEFFFLIDKKQFWAMIMIFSLVEVSLNTFNSLKNNYRYKSYYQYQNVRKALPDIIDKLDKENEYFYRMELESDYTSNDGLFFGYNGIDYFNSARNIKVIQFLKSIGLTVYDDCHVELLDLDPFVLSLLNIKYIYTTYNEYLTKLDDMKIYENAYPLSLGFMTDESIKDLTLNESRYKNLNNLFQSLTGSEEKLYTTISYNKFEGRTSGDYELYTYKFTSDKRYIVMSNTDHHSTININQKVSALEGHIYKIIEPKDKVIFEYSTGIAPKKSEVYLVLFDIDLYEREMAKLEENLLKAKTYQNGHILEGTIESKKDGLLFTSIEYESGMKVYVDGKETKPTILFDSLIGIPLKEGKHTIYIDYIPKGIIPGSIISLIYLIVTILYLQIRKKKL